MRRTRVSGALVLALAATMISSARADQQLIAPGTGGSQNAVVVDTGADGLCETVAAGDDIQVATIGQGTPFQNEVRCGPNLIADTAAVADDTQLVAVGASCKTANRPAGRSVSRSRTASSRVRRVAPTSSR